MHTGHASSDGAQPGRTQKIHTHAQHVQTHTYTQDMLGVMVRSLAERSQHLRGADFASVFLALGVFDAHPGTDMCLAMPALCSVMRN